MTKVTGVLAILNKRLEYLHQYIGYESIIIKLFDTSEIMLELNADFIEYEWIEKKCDLFTARSFQK